MAVSYRREVRRGVRYEDQPGGSGKPLERTDVHTGRPLRRSGTCRAFTMACIRHGAETKDHLLSVTSHMV